MTRGPGPRSLRAPLPAPTRCRPLLVRGTGEGTRARPTDGCGVARMPGRLSAGVAALGLGGAGAAAALSLPNKEEAVPRPPRSRRREGALTLARQRWVASFPAAARAPSGLEPSRLASPSRPTPEFRSKSCRSACGRAEMPDPERVLCERAGFTKKVLVGDVGTSRNWEDARF